MKEPDLAFTELEIELAMESIGEDLRALRPEFTAMSDEELREIFNSDSEPDIRKLTAKLEGLNRYGFGPNDRMH